MNILNTFSDCSNKTYSQCGEDRIIQHIFSALDIDLVRYLDIGANDPRRFSNTYLFYKEGGSGVLVEPDPGLYKKLLRHRKRDICLHAGIAGTSENRKQNFFIMSSSTLNTFSAAEADRVQRETAHKIKKVIDIPLIGINEVLQKYFGNGLDLLSLDVEGMDLQIIQAIDFTIVRPTVICVETLTYSEKREGKKIAAIADYLKSKKYWSYGDTYINTIFLDQFKWQES